MASYNGKTGSTAWYEYNKQSGFQEYLREQGFDLPLPTHNYELLKEALEQKYQSKLAEHLAERSNNGFIDTPCDIARFRLIWLKDMLTRNVEAWINPTGKAAIIRKHNPSDQIELEKYRDYIVNDMEATEKEILHSQISPNSSVDQSTTLAQEKRSHNQLIYESWEKQWIDSQSFDSDKSFGNRKEKFINRIINAIHPDEQLEKEIKTIRNEYEQPDKTWDKHSEHFNVHIKVFRDRLSGVLLDVSKDGNERRDLHQMLKFIEGDHAYQYYKYLIELQRRSNWLSELKGTPTPPPSTRGVEMNQLSQALARIDKRISGHVLNTDGFLRKADPALYAPVEEYWQQIDNEERPAIIKRYVGCVGEFIEKANELADAWYNEMNQDAALQPDRAINIWNEYRDYYIDQIKSTYQPVRSWYTNHWNTDESRLKDVEALEREIFTFCFHQSLPFENGLCLLANLYACYFVVSRFNSELNNQPATDTPAIPANDERKNVFNSMPLNEVRQWFIQLTETNSKNGKPFLTVEQVEQFIDRAFCGNDNIKSLTFNLPDGERTSVTKLFYSFYGRCTNDYAIEPTKHCKEKYVRLLTDNFTNYDYRTVFGTFNNSKNAPKQWRITV